MLKPQNRLRNERVFIERISRYLGTYIDVGAHIGDTIYWARKAAMVIAIEPDPRCLNQIGTVARKLKLRNFKLFAKVVGDGRELDSLLLQKEQLIQE